MAIGKKKERATKERPARKHVKGENFYRTADKVKRLNVFTHNKATRDSRGNVLREAPFQSKDAPTARIAPDRRWFGNTRVISQDALAAFREAMATKARDPNTVLLRRNKLPMSLIEDVDNKNHKKAKDRATMEDGRSRVLEPDFGSVFGPKAQRNRVTLAVSSFDDLGEKAATADADMEIGDAAEGQAEAEGREMALDSAFSKGQSGRIWGELHKVIDASDVVLHVLDARDPLGTRCHAIENHIANDNPHKHLVFVLNKCDLVPSRVAAKWVRHLSAIRPTLAFRANIKNPFGKGSLISLLRQFRVLLKERKQITACVVGYPNTGKSSILNTLRGKKVAETAPIPGETKIWQYVSLTTRILLLDCPGVVPRSANLDPTDILLRGAIRVELISSPAAYIPALLERCQLKHVTRTYGIGPEGGDVPAFLTALGRRMGRLLKGGEVDCDEAARIVIRDFLRGNLPWFTPPPGGETAATGDERGVDGGDADKSGEAEGGGNAEEDDECEDEGEGEDEEGEDEDEDDEGEDEDEDEEGGGAEDEGGDSEEDVDEA